MASSVNALISEILSLLLGGSGGNTQTPVTSTPATTNATSGAVQAPVSNAGASILPGANNVSGIPSVPSLTRASLHTAIGENKATPEQVNQGYQRGFVDAYGQPQQAQGWNNPTNFSTGTPNTESGLSEWDDKVYKANQENARYTGPYQPGVSGGPPQKKLTELSSSMNWLFYPDYMKHSTGTKVNTGIGMR